MSKIDSGWQSRLNILRRSADEKIISKLKTHGWVAKIASETSKGEYLIVEASRGGHCHKIALMYSSATDNKIYQSLETQVEHIYINGELYKLEQFAYGIKTSVAKIDDFHDLLLEWNQSISNGLFAPSTSVSRPDQPKTFPDHFRIQSENPIQTIWMYLRQLESITLAKRHILDRANECSIKLTSETVHTKGEGLAFTLRNATDYFRSAISSNMSQRILNLYYGHLAFAFAEMLASPDGPATLAEIENITKQGHGLFTMDGKSEKLEDLIVGVIKSGFFPSYLDFLGCSTSEFPAKKARKLEDLTENQQFHHTFEELLSRISDIGDLFTKIFHSKPGWIIPSYDSEANSSRTFGSSSKKERSYVRLIDRSGRWQKEDVPKIRGPISEISDISNEDHSKIFRVAVDHSGYENFWSALEIYKSPYITHSLILPIFGSVGAYRAMCLSILYSLSIVVRYRPSLWRRIQEGDLEYMRVLIEAFLESIERNLPQEYLQTITGKTVIAKQPGSFF